MRSHRKYAIVIALIVLGCLALVLKIRNTRKLAQEVNEAKSRAESGDTNSEAALSILYYFGRGLPQNYSEAFRWASKAAELGSLRSEYDLGLMYARGQGVTQNDSQAFYWLQKAASQGQPSAQSGLGVLYYQGRGVQQDYAIAADWFRKAAEQGSPAGQYWLGYVYQYGQGVPQNSAEAERWYKKASARGDEQAERALGLRGRGFNNIDILTLISITMAWIWAASGLLSSKRAVEQRRVQIAVMVTCGLIYVAIRVFTGYSGFRTPIEFAIVQLAENIACGISIGTLVYLSRSLAKKAKLIWQIVIASMIAGAFYILLHRDLWSLSSWNRPIFIFSGFLLGIAIPISIFCASSVESPSKYSDHD